MTICSLLPPDQDTALLHALDHARVPDHLHDGLMNYLRYGIPPGSCLQAILSNDLKEACFKADPVTEGAFRHIVLFLASHAPWDSWGSEDAYTAWVTTGSELRASIRSQEEQAI